MSVYKELLSRNQDDTSDQPSATADREPQMQPESQEMDRAIVPLLDHINQAQSERGKAVFGFLGPAGGEGASSIVLEVMRLLTRRGIESRCLVVDANWQSPTLSTALNASTNNGLLSLMTGKSSLEEAVLQDVFPGVDLVSTGLHKDFSGVEISNGLFQTELFRARKKYDIIMFDLVPLRHPESLPILRLLDGVFLVLEADKTKHSTGLQSITRLNTLGVNVEGIVLNKRSRRIPQFIYSRL